MLSAQVVTRLVPRVMAALAGLVLASCAGRERPARSTADPAEAARWRSMSQEQRFDYMRDVVTPEMRELFAAFDGRRYGRLGCETCHGRDGAARAWKMPSPDLLLEEEAVSASGASAPAPAHHHGGPAAADLDTFMKTKVTPRMAELIGGPPGFDCWGCHTRDR